jgi:enoyl-[acyl-carrier protein] reductase I
VHGAAFANRDDLIQPFTNTTREGFKTALDISAYSLVALARAGAPLMEKKGGGSILTLSYLGSERVFTNYNVMGVAKAALEATVRYLAADLGPRNIRVNAVSAGRSRRSLRQEFPDSPQSLPSIANARPASKRRNR